MTLIADLLVSEHQRLLRPSGGCYSCPRRRVDFVPPTLKSGKLLILGEAPGEEEVAQGEGFVGTSGRKLRGDLKRVAGIPVEECSFSNAIHCRPPNNATPGAKEIACCLSQFVLDEIRDYPLVMLAGGVPLQALFPGVTPAKFRGNVAWHPDFPGQRFYATYHPAYLLRRKDMTGEWEQQLARLGRVYRGEPAPEWQVVRGPGEIFHSHLQAALQAPLLCLDLETNRLESWAVDSRIRSVALTADGKTVLSASEEEPHFLGVLEAIRGFLERPEKHVVGMNTGFDLQWLEEELGFRVRATGIHDVATIWYEARQYKMPSLKELVAKELDGYRYLIHSPYLETDPDRLALYNAEDVVHTLALFHKGMPLVTPKTRDMLMRVSGPSGYVLRQITRNGFPIRRDYWQQKITEYEEKHRATLLAWKVTDPEFVPTYHNSGKGLREYLFGLKRLPPLHRSRDTGEPSTDETALKEWIRQGASYLKHLLELREIEKFRGTYLDAYKTHVDGNCRIHSSYTNTFTDSARSSSRDPNLQNIPRNQEIRDLFGGPFLEADLSQIEFRIVVCLARDQGGIQAYQRGLDAHTMTARSFATNPEVPTSEERSWAKPVNFSLLFGGDEYNVQQRARNDYGLDWSLAESARFVRAFWKTFPRLPEYHRERRERFEADRGWFESVTGHVFHYRDWDHPDQAKRGHAFRAYLNAHAQGPAAQICFLIMVLADRLLVEREVPARMVNTVHDSVLFQLPDLSWTGPTVAALEEARALAYEWIKSWFIVPLVMDYKVGPSWGSLEEWRPT